MFRAGNGARQVLRRWWRPVVDEKLNGREAQRRQTRERLYAVAIAEFKRTGMAAADVGVIAKEAGVARGTFYFHFPTKEHVLAEMERGEEVGELCAYPRLLGPLKLGQHVLLGREVKVERPARDPRLLGDEADVGRRHPGLLELGDRHRVQALASLPSLGLSAVELLVHHRTFPPPQIPQAPLPAGNILINVVGPY